MAQKAIHLLFDVLGGASLSEGSGKEIVKQLTGIVNEINSGHSSVPKIELMASVNKESVKEVTKELSGIANSSGIKSISSLTDTITDLFNTLRANIATISLGISKQLSDIFDAIPEGTAGDSIKKITRSVEDLVVQITELGKTIEEINGRVGTGGVINNFLGDSSTDLDRLKLIGNQAQETVQYFSKLKSIIDDSSSGGAYYDRFVNSALLKSGMFDKISGFNMEKVMSEIAGASVDGAGGEASLNRIISLYNQLNKILIDIFERANSGGKNYLIPDSSALVEARDAVAKYKKAVTETNNEQGEDNGSSLGFLGNIEKINGAFADIENSVNNLRLKFESAFDFSTIDMHIDSVKEKINSLGDLSALVSLVKETNKISGTSKKTNRKGRSEEEKAEAKAAAEEKWKLEHQWAESERKYRKGVLEEEKAEAKAAAEAKWKLEQQLKEAERQHLKEVAAEEKAAAEQKRAEEQENARNAREAEQAYNKERNDKYSRLSSTVKDYYKSLEAVQKLELKTDSIEDESFQRRVSSYTQLKNEFSELGFSLNERGNALSEISEEQRVANAERLNISLEQYNKLYETANRLARENYISQEKNGESLQRTWDKNAAKVHDYITRVRQVISKNKDVLKAADSLDELTKSGDPRHLEDLTRRFAELQLQIRSTGADTETWFQKLKKTFGTRVRSLLAGATIGRITMYIRQMYNEVKDIDTAITTLKIVTGESERAMSQYADSIAKSAIKIGASIPDLIDSTTVFARLGYTLEESSRLAEIATAYSKVGDVNIDEASKNLTAIIKAYDIQADQIEGVVDKLIYVGNKFPISSAEIGEGMNNAASALKANGNTLNEALGLLSSANTTVDFCRLSWKHDIRKVA